MRTNPNVLVIAATCVMFAMPLHSQNIPTQDLGKRTGRTPYSFGLVGNVAELPDGRVVVVDFKEKLFRIADFAHGTMDAIGGPGDGEFDYSLAGQIIRWKADSLLLYVADRDHQRFLHLSPQGKIVSASPIAMPIPEDPPTTGGYSIAGPFAVDSSCAAYFMVTLRDSTLTPHELADVVRVPLGGVNRKVVDYVRERRANQGRTTRARTLANMPFYFRDGWAMRPDGLAARVAADTYEVIWSRNGRATGRTGPLPFTPIPLTEAEQTAYKDSIIGNFNPPPPSADGSRPSAPASAGGGGSARMGSGAPTTGDNTPRSFTPPPATTTLRIPEFGAFPDRKPAIPNLRTLGVVQFDLAGRLWINRERAHGDNIPHLDVVDERRGLVAHVNLPKNTRLVGFGANTIYLVNHDDNGDWLERYPLPNF